MHSFFVLRTGTRVDRRLAANVPARTCMRIQHASAHAGCELQLHTIMWGPRDPTPRTRQAGPPTTLAPTTRTNVRCGFQFPLHLRRGSLPTSTLGLAGPSAAGPHIPMVGNHGDIFLPPDPVGPGRRTGVYPPARGRLPGWCKHPTPTKEDCSGDATVPSGGARGSHPV